MADLLQNGLVESPGSPRPTRPFRTNTQRKKKRFHAKMGLIKDRNCMDLTEAEDIKKK